MMSLSARRELLRAVPKRYQAANKRDKSQILNEFVVASSLSTPVSGLLSNSARLEFKDFAMSLVGMLGE